MVMKRPSAMISPSDRVPEQGCRSPKLDYRGDSSSLYVSWKISPSPIKLGLKATYRRRGDGRRWPGAPHDPQARPRVDPLLAGVWVPPGSPPGLLRAFSLFRVKIDLRCIITLPLRIFASRGIYRRRMGTGGQPGPPHPTWARPHLGPRPPRVWGPGGSSPGALRTPEIGRASCRERVYVLV